MQRRKKWIYSVIFLFSFVFSLTIHDSLSFVFKSDPCWWAHTFLNSMRSHCVAQKVQHRRLGPFNDVAPGSSLLHHLDHSDIELRSQVRLHSALSALLHEMDPQSLLRICIWIVVQTQIELPFLSLMQVCKAMFGYWPQQPGGARHYTPSILCCQMSWPPRLVRRARSHRPTS